MRREVIHIQVVKQRMEPDNIGYVRLTEFTEQADAALKQAVKAIRQQAGGKLRALVLDLSMSPLCRGGHASGCAHRPVTAPVLSCHSAR